MSGAHNVDGVHGSTALVADRECGVSAARAASCRPLQMIMGK